MDEVTMTKTPTAMVEAKRLWTQPRLNRLGTIKDVAGPNGAAAQSPVQNRS
jgi:hypothetical protein